MVARMIVLFFLWASASLAASPASEVSLGGSVGHRKAKLTGGQLESDNVPSQSSALRLTDDLRMFHTQTSAPLDQGGGGRGGSEVRQILALILGFFPGFGLGHLVARDKQGFILFLVIDVVLYVLGGVFWGLLWTHAWVFPVGALVWLVVHIIQALDAYGEAGGPKIVDVLREKAVRVASQIVPRRDEPVITTRIFEYRF